MARWPILWKLSVDKIFTITSCASNVRILSFSHSVLFDFCIYCYFRDDVIPSQEFFRRKRSNVVLFENYYSFRVAFIDPFPGSVCAQTLNVKTFKKYEGKIFCATHCPKPSAGPIGADSIHMKNALSTSSDRKN